MHQLLLCLFYGVFIAVSKYLGQLGQRVQKLREKEQWIHYNCLPGKQEHFHILKN